MDSASGAHASSFDDFVRDRGRALWRAAFLLTGDPHTAEDLVQTALSRTFRRYDGIANDAAFDVYVRTTMYRTFCSWWRRAWRGESPTASMPEILSTDPVDEERLDVLRALHELPPRQRSILVLRYFEDRSITEVATLLGVTEGTVKSASHKGVAAMRGSVHLIDQEADHER